MKNGNETVAPPRSPTDHSTCGICSSYGAFLSFFFSAFSAFLSFPPKQVKSLLALAHIYGFAVLEATIVLEKLQYLSEMWLRFVSL